MNTAKYDFAQSLFTRRYLQENGKLHIWEIMGEYTKTVADSRCVNASAERLSGRIGRANAVFINTMMHDVWIDWIKNNLGTIDGRVLTEDERNSMACAGRVCDRLGADIWRADGVMVRLLVAKLLARLSCNENLKVEALSGLVALVSGFYKGAEHYLKSVNLHG